LPAREDKSRQDCVEPTQQTNPQQSRQKARKREREEIAACCARGTCEPNVLCCAACCTAALHRASQCAGALHRNDHWDALCASTELCQNSSSRNPIDSIFNPVWPLARLRREVWQAAGFWLECPLQIEPMLACHHRWLRGQIPGRLGKAPGQGRRSTFAWGGRWWFQLLLSLQTSPLRSDSSHFN